MTQENNTNILLFINLLYQKPPSLGGSEIFSPSGSEVEPACLRAKEMVAIWQVR